MRIYIRVRLYVTPFAAVRGSIVGIKYDLEGMFKNTLCFLFSSHSQVHNLGNGHIDVDGVTCDRSSHVSDLTLSVRHEAQ